jgi:3-oxoacyl-[acyl-carrier protein] reductase
VRDDEDALAWVLVRDPLHRGQHASEVLGPGLAVMVLRARETLCDLGPREARPRPDIDLPQAGVRAHRHAVGRREDLRGFARSGQIARVDGGKGRRCEPLGELTRLCPAELVERRVGVSLEAPVAIPVGLSVSRQQNRRCHVGYGNRMDLELAGKVAIVTGSSRGIGRAIAAHLVEEGADVVFCARGDEALQAAVAEAAGPGRAHAVAADVSTPDGAAAVVSAAEEHFGGVDIVVNNVGGSGARTFDDTDAADLAAVLDKNLVPALLVSRAALTSLRARGGGVIAIISSVFGRESGGGPSYNLAKAAEISLAKSMARDLAKDGIRVFSVAPGSVRFPGGSWDRRLLEDPEGTTAFVEREIPWGRFGTVDEIADVVTFLVSSRAAWVVGACVPVDGGQSRAF